MQLKTLIEKLKILGDYCGNGVYFEAAITSTRCSLEKCHRNGELDLFSDYDKIEKLIEEIDGLVELTDVAHNPTNNWWLQ